MQHKRLTKSDDGRRPNDYLGCFLVLGTLPSVEAEWMSCSEIEGLAKHFKGSVMYSNCTTVSFVDGRASARWRPIVFALVASPLCLDIFSVAGWHAPTANKNVTG